MFKGFFSSRARASARGSAQTDPAKISEILTRGVEEIFVRESLEAKLRSGRRLRVKLGIDPTGKNVHIGNAIVLRKLRAFQDLGHKVVLVVGDFTAKIGDPSDKLEKRPVLTAAQIRENLAGKNGQGGYLTQIGKILDLKRAEVVYNSAWLSRLRFDEICELASAFSVQQMIARRNFKDRIEAGTEISLREFLYPLMQGYDSVAVKADVELGGFDQLFNVKAGRTVQKHYGVADQNIQDILVTKMIFGTDGRKMSKSWGNVINISDPADEMFGKIMSLRDDLMQSYFLLCTDMPETEALNIGARLEGGANPRDLKLELAGLIVAIYWGREAAVRARQKFIETFSEKKIPDDIETVSVNPGETYAGVALEKGLVASKTEWRRLVAEGAVTDATTGTAVTDPNAAAEGKTLRIGKRRFLKIEIRS